MKRPRSEAGAFSTAAAAAIVTLLEGGDPVRPQDLTLPGPVRGSVPDGIESAEALDRWLDGNWGWLALTYWCRFSLSNLQRMALLAQHYDLDALGTDFFQYLTNCMGARGDAVIPPKHYICTSQHPPGVLKEWFGRFLSSSKGPFAPSLKWKLKQRFDDILRSDARFAPVREPGAGVAAVEDEPEGLKRRKGEVLWTLAAVRRWPGMERGSPAGLSAHLKATTGELTPLVYRKDAHRVDRAGDGTESTPPDDAQGDAGRMDPIISREDALRIAETAIAFAGPMPASDLAGECLALLPPGLQWAQITFTDSPITDAPGRDRSEEERGARHAAPATPAAEWPCESRPGTDEHAANDLPRVRDAAARARKAWQMLEELDQVVAAARLFQSRPWTFREIAEWTRTRLEPGCRVTLQEAQRRAGTKDARITRLLEAARRKALGATTDEDVRKRFLDALTREARKLLESPPSYRVSKRPAGEETSCP